jgi:hypothetical protein
MRSSNICDQAFVKSKSNLMFDIKTNKDIDKIEKESIDTINRTICCLHETRKISCESMMLLDKQGEQIAHISGKMDYISALQGQADRYLRTISSVVGSTVNKVSDLNPVPWSSIRSLWSSKYDHNNRERLDVHIIEPVQVTKIKNPDQIDVGLDIIDNILKELHKDAIQMGQELDRHNHALTSLNDVVDETRFKMHTQTNYIKRWT